MSDDGLKLFTSPALLGVFDGIRGFSLRYMVCQSDSGADIAICPVFTRDKFGIKTLANPPLLPYNEITYIGIDSIPVNKQAEYQLEINQTLAEHLRIFSRRAFFALHPNHSDIRGFTGKKFQATPLYTNRINLETWNPADYRSSRKNDLKKMSKYKVTLIEGFNAESLIELADKTYARKGKKLPLTNAEQKQLLTHLEKNNTAVQYSLLINDKLAAVKLTLLEPSTGTAYAWQGYNDPEFLSLGVSTRFTHEMLVLLKEQGYRHYDFCGANVLSIASFKAGFGGEVTVYYKLTFSDVPLLDALYRMWKYVRGLFRP
ncbi:MAG: GNAT family N-acetyltransferase [Candidatus Cloacimonetes bacterium]|nr:GNAT family N-acetyltransferase [Candidatus Cloacimonadota bacterium]